MTNKAAKHPFFVKLGYRQEILLRVDPSQLCLEKDKYDDVYEFSKLFSLPVEDQFQQFCIPNSKYPRVFSELIETRNLNDTLSLLCAFIDNLLDIDFNQVIRCLTPFSLTLIKSCINILVSQLKTSGSRPFLIRTVHLIFSTLISEKSVEFSEEILNIYIKITKDLLQLPVSSLGLEGLKKSLRSDDIRSKFVENSGVPLIINIIISSSKLIQSDTLYQALFCIWGLTYNVEGSGALLNDEFISLLSRLLSTTAPEKEEIIRVLILILTNMLDSIVFIELAYDYDILKLLRTLQSKHYVDKEINQKVSSVADELHKKLKHLSLWDKYVREVKSGKLKNNQNHRSELFWKTNIEKFGEHDYSILLDLKKLINSSDEETVIVAVHDIGEYVMRHPIGKKIIQDLGIKEIIVGLISNKSKQIQSEALRTTQLMLLK